jgi:hypothetical protein
LAHVHFIDVLFEKFIVLLGVFEQLFYVGFYLT